MIVLWGVVQLAWCLHAFEAPARFSNKLVSQPAFPNRCALYVLGILYDSCNIDRLVIIGSRATSKRG